MKTFLFCGLALIALCAFSGCNTVRGMGQDLQGVGHGVQRAADWCTPSN